MQRLRHTRQGGDAQASDIRRCRNTLAVSGGAVIASAIWAGVKTFVLAGLSEPAAGLAAGSDVSWATGLVSIVESIPVAQAVLLLVALAIIPLDFLVRIYVGRAALAESRGECRSPLYVLLATVISALIVAGMAVTLVLSHGLVELDDLLVTAVVDVTTLVMMTDLIRAALKLRRLDPQLYDGGR